MQNTHTILTRCSQSAHNALKTLRRGIIVSHNSNDHAGGLGAIQRAFPIGRLNHSDPERSPSGDCELQDPWVWDDVWLTSCV